MLASGTGWEEQAISWMFWDIFCCYLLFILATAAIYKASAALIVSAQKSVVGREISGACSCELSFEAGQRAMAKNVSSLRKAS